MATKEQVLAAYAANPKAELAPNQAAIDFWMNNDLTQFNNIVDAVRAANPTLATQIDTQRAAATAGNNNVVSNAVTGGLLTSNNVATGNNVVSNNVVTGNDGNASVAASVSPNMKLILDAYKTLGRTGVGTGTNQIDQAGLNYWLGEVESGRLKPADFNKTFYQSVGNYYTQKPTDAITQYTAPILLDNTYRDILTKAYGGIGRTGFGTDVKQIDQGGFDFWLNAMKSGQYNTNGQFDPNKFLTNFNSAVTKYKTDFPTSDLTKYVTPYTPVTPDKITTDMLINAINPTGIATPVTPVGQFKDLFPAFSESKRLAGEMVANRPSMDSIIAMLQGQGQQMPVTTSTTTPVTGQTTNLANVLSMIGK
tara:strand:- start:308 stop:1402 length:1095 start_codon:yes stop_codon:yes gene_type:complete